MSSAAMASQGHDDDDSGITLSSVFNFAAKATLLYVGFGLFDLALWHYDPGGVALFDAVKDPILTLLDVTGVSDALNWLAGTIGGGTEQMAIDLGGAELNMGGIFDNTFVPDY